MNRARKVATLVFAVVYMLAAVGFWIAGIIAYLVNFSGPPRLLGFLLIPILALPVVGRGQVVGLAVRSPLWWWWFGGLLALAALAGFLYPPREAEAEQASGEGGHEDAAQEHGLGG